jgi:uncharacterized protein DUF5615
VLKLVSDENFDGDILRGLYRRRPDLDVVRVQDIGLNGTPDPDILEWAAVEGRILLTHDRDTMPNFAYERVRASEAMPGVFLVSDLMPIGQAIEERAFLRLRADEARGGTAKQLRTVKDPMVISAFSMIWISPICDSRVCDFCYSQAGRLIKVGRCTVDDLPPFRQCKNRHDGCRCASISLPFDRVLKHLSAGDAWFGDQKKTMIVAERRDFVHQEMACQRERAAGLLQALKSAKVIGAFPFIKIEASHDSSCCKFCASKDGRVIPIEVCTIDDLPPFQQCENTDDGCRCKCVFA